MAHDPEWVQSSNQPATDEFDDVPVWLANEPPEATAVAVAAPAVVVPATGGRAAQTNWADPRTGQEAVRRAAQQAATDAATAQVAQSAADAAKDLGEMPRAWLIMRIANPIVAVLILACVIGKLDSIDFFTKFDAIVICVYLIIFSLLLCCFELCGTISIAASILAENFGFLYTVVGRLVFLIFTGVLVLSLNTNFAYIACAITLADAVYNAVVLAMYPDWTLAMVLKHQEAARSRFRQ